MNPAQSFNCKPGRQGTAVGRSAGRVRWQSVHVSRHTTVMSPRDNRLDTILRAHEPRLRALFLRHLGARPDIDVDDLVQEARIRLWKALEREQELTAITTYIQRVVTSVVVDALRRRSARPEVTVEEPLEHVAVADAAAPERACAQAQRAEALHAALARLSPRRRRAAALLLQGYSTQEIASLLGETEATVRNLAYRGIDDMKALLAGNALAETSND